MVGKELVEIVEWNEIQEICKAMQSICRDRQRWNELCYYPHPDKNDEFASSYRLNYDRIIKRIYLTYNMALSRLAIRAREKGLFGNTGLSLEEALKRFLPVTTYKFGNTPRHRLLINRDIARGNEFYALPAYSDVLDDDNDPEPLNFEYMNENLYEEKFRNVGKLKYCCDCVGICAVDTCSCILRDRQMNFGKMYCPLDRRFILQEEPQNDYVNDMTVEATRIMCGPECSCNKECLYRYDNIPSIHKFEVFKRDSQLGFGLRVLNNVKQGEPIVEFAGQVYVSPSYYNWGKARLDAFNNYSYQVSSRFWKTDVFQAEVLNRMNQVFPELKRKFDKYRPKNAFIMPYEKGNAGRFISHGCLPNCLLMRVAVNDLRLEKHRILIVANEDIPAGSELYIDYGQKMEEEAEPKRPQKRTIGRKRRRGHKKNASKTENTSGSKCKCGTVLCRENLPALARIMEGITLKDTWKPCYQYAKNLRKLTEQRRQQFGQWLNNNGSLPCVEPDLKPEELQKQIKLIAEEFTKPDTLFRKLDDPEVQNALDFKIQRTVQPEIVHLSDDDNEEEYDTEDMTDRTSSSEGNGAHRNNFQDRDAEQDSNTSTSSSRASPESAESVVYTVQPTEDDEIVFLGDITDLATQSSGNKVTRSRNTRVMPVHGRTSPTESNSSSYCSTVSSALHGNESSSSFGAPIQPSPLADSRMIYGPFAVPKKSPEVKTLKRNSIGFLCNFSKTDESNNPVEIKPTSYKNLVMARINEKKHNSAIDYSSSNQSDECKKLRPAPPPWPRQKEEYF